MAERDQALVKILERLAAEMTQQDEKLAALLVRQNELSSMVGSAGLHLRGGQAETERSYDKLLDLLNRYRSDMLALVSEQDRINRNIEALQSQLKTTTYTVDVTSQKLVEMSERLLRIEKASNSHYEYASKQPEIFRDALDGTSRDFAGLHASTEKHLSDMQKDMERRLNDFQHEIMRHLLLLDGIVPSLETLLLRTEPPEKKPIWIVRLFGKLRRSLRRLKTSFAARKE